MNRSFLWFSYSSILVFISQGFFMGFLCYAFCFWAVMEVKKEGDTLGWLVVRKISTLTCLAKREERPWTGVWDFPSRLYKCYILYEKKHKNWSILTNRNVFVWWTITLVHFRVHDWCLAFASIKAAPKGKEPNLHKPQLCAGTIRWFGSLRWWRRDFNYNR